MTVSIHLYSQVLPCIHDGVRNTYTKDGLYCVLLVGNTSVVYKYPVQHIFRIVEDECPE